MLPFIKDIRQYLSHQAPKWKFQNNIAPKRNVLSLRLKSSRQPHVVALTKLKSSRRHVEGACVSSSALYRVSTSSIELLRLDSLRTRPGCSRMLPIAFVAFTLTLITAFASRWVCPRAAARGLTIPFLGLHCEPACGCSLSLGYLG